MKMIDTDLNSIIRMYESGLTHKNIASNLGVSKSLITKRLREAGYVSRSRRATVDDAGIVSDYLGGLSENATAKKHGRDRNVIRRVLLEGGVCMRSQSEAEILKWSTMIGDARTNQVSAANQAMRNQTPEFHHRSAILQAKAKENSLSKACDMETLFIREFEKLGFATAPQKAFGPYNIDIAIGNTAIEIHNSSCHPHTHSYYRKRIVNLLKGGWHVVYIKAACQIDANRAAHKVGEMIDLIESDKSSVRHYGVIRGSGQFIAGGRLDGDDLSGVSGSYAFFQAIA
jgi:hypothetical protein